MIQELLSAVVEERKFSFPGGGGGLLSDAPSPFLSSASVATSPSASAASEALQEKLRCPRCDSSNTKFCYYNNYNLTQPRHFCKTCRRYWTKGGALRNVPIGGGCRKAKPAPTIAPGCKLGGGSKPNKPISSLDAIARAGFGLEPELFQPSPILWATPPPPHTSHLLALLRAGGGGGLRNFDHNPLQSLNSFRIKEERMESEPAGCGLGQQGPSYDPLGQLSSPAGMGSLWRNEGQLQYLQLPENNALFGDVAVGIQELYQRLRPQAGTMVLTNYSGDQSSMSSGYGPAVGCSSSTTSAAMVSNIGGGGGEGGVAAVTAPIMPAIAPAMGSEFGYWTPALSWSDMSGTN